MILESNQAISSGIRESSRIRDGCMAELRFKVDDRFMDQLSKMIGDRSYTEIVRDALTILKWAAEERRRDRYIVSADADGKDAHRLVLPSLEIAAALGKVEN